MMMAEEEKTTKIKNFSENVKLKDKYTDLYYKHFQPYKYHGVKHKSLGVNYKYLEYCS